VARLALDLSSNEPAGVTRHVGWFLIDGGRAALEQVLRYRPPPGTRLLRAVRNHPGRALAIAMTLGTVTALALLLWLAGPAARPAWLAIVLLGLLPAHEITVRRCSSSSPGSSPAPALADFVDRASIPLGSRPRWWCPRCSGLAAAGRRWSISRRSSANRDPI
jgi:cyclic beta-1,2-glucan synthetase